MTRRLICITILAVIFLLAMSGLAFAETWTDISDATWRSDYNVSAAEAATVADGYADGTFQPYRAVTRGQFAKMVVTGFGLSTSAPLIPTFSDVPLADTYSPWVEGGVAAGIMGGFDDGTFRAQTSVSRQQANSILGLFLSQKELSLTGHIRGDLSTYGSLGAWYAAEGATALASFADRTSLAPVHAPATASLALRHVVLGSARSGGLYLDPVSSLTRAQAVALILRVKGTTFVTTGLHLHISGISSPATAGTASSATVTVVDEASAVVTGYTGTVNFTSTDPYPAVLPANYTFTALDAGTHTFAGGVTLKTAGSQTVTATDTVTGAITGYQTVIVTPAVLDHFSFGTITSPQVAGAPFSITITAKDLYGNTVTTYTSPAALTATTSVIVPSSTAAFVAGIWTGNVTIATAGAQAITATGSTKTGTSAPIVLTAGPVSAAQSTVTAAPASVVANGIATSTITVTLKDLNTNPVADKTVTLAKTSGPGTPTISAASGVSSASGMVTFTVRSTTTAADLFTATDTTDSLVITQTASVTFTAGAATKVVIENAATSAGTPVGATTVIAGSHITVYANSHDQYDNFVANVAATWSLSNLTGGVVTGDLVPAISTSSASAVFTGHLEGTCKINAAAGGLTSGITGTVTVNPGAANKLVFTTQPSATTVSGVAFATQPVVTVQDAAGNTVIGATTSITLAIKADTGTAGAALAGTKTATVSSGVATFAGLSVDLAGTAYKLTAIGTGLTAGDSAEFTITTISLTIGDSYQGGKVAYILQSGDPGYSATVQHGLIAATADQSTGIRWNNGSDTVTGATETALGTGFANTNTIIAVQGATATSYAAGLARAYSGGGYSDWYLPSKDELAKLHVNRGAIGGFESVSYWSSSEYTASNAWAQDFDNGSQNLNNKGFAAVRVRAVRAF